MQDFLDKVNRYVSFRIKNTRSSYFVFGGIGMLNTPLNDAWILEVTDDLIATWKPFPLKYDHGEVRCLHGSCCLTDGSQILIHSGTLGPNNQKILLYFYFGY